MASSAADPSDVLAAYPPDRIRNFGIVAHIDAGKSSLANNLLALTGTISEAVAESGSLYMDKLQVEKQRGITVKSQCATMFHNGYALNLIDTPGHFDFQYEVQRSLSACENVVLLVDATQGVQAQTISTYRLAAERELTVLPVITKIDMQELADIDACVTQLMALMGERDRARMEARVLLCSNKTREGVADVIDAIVERGRPPAVAGGDEAASRTTMFCIDAWYDQFHGAIMLVKVLGGALAPNDHYAVQSHTSADHEGEVFHVLQTGVMSPEMVPTARLYAGQVGYVVSSGLRDIRKVRLGATFVGVDAAAAGGGRGRGSGRRATSAAAAAAAADSSVDTSLERPVLYATLYPLSPLAEHVDRLRNAIEKLQLQDAAVTCTVTPSHSALGIGFLLSFSGVLHREVFVARLKDEFDVDVFATQPCVPLKLENTRTGECTVLTSAERVPPVLARDERLLEPIVDIHLVAPATDRGTLMQLLVQRRAVHVDTQHDGGEHISMHYRVPWLEVVTGLQEAVKEATSGYGHLTTGIGEPTYEPADVVVLQYALNGEVVGALSSVCARQDAPARAHATLMRLKETLPRQQFALKLQALVKNRVIARETLGAVRKDVTAKVYGRDVTRKKKLLEKQKAGKKRMRSLGSVSLSHSDFLKVFS